MKHLMMYEDQREKQYRRGLLSFDETLQSVCGYINCMSDYGIIEKDRAAEEKALFVKRLLDL